MYTVGILTISDKGSQGLRKDLSGPAIVDILKAHSAQWQICDTAIVPDEKTAIEKFFTKNVSADIALILTTGGTGCSVRDITPEVTVQFCERLIPGIPEMMRLTGLEHTPLAMLSRAACGIRQGTIIVNLPGSPKAIHESLPPILPLLEHALHTIRQPKVDCN